MKKYNIICKDYAAAADRVGFSKQEITGICNKCTVPLAWGRCMRVDTPGECDLFAAIISRYAVKSAPVAPVRPCDFIPSSCRHYVGSLCAWTRAKTICAGCAGSGQTPGIVGCALYDNRYKK